MEMQTCCICNLPSRLVIGQGNDFEYDTLPETFKFVLCEKCNHMYLTHPPEKSLLKVIYPDTYYTINRDSPLFLKSFIYKKKLQMDTKRIVSFVKDIEINSVLEIGAGDCERLLNLKKVPRLSHIDLTAIDILFNDEIIEKAGKNRIRLISGNIEDVEGLDEKYDLIIMSQLLEHLYDPAAAIRKAGSLLSRNGIVIIETPCFGSLDYSIFKSKYWGAFHIPRHFNIFSQRSLETLLSNCGLEVIKKGYLPSPGFWIISIRNILGLNSIRSGRSLFEMFNFQFLPTVGFFTVLDRLTILLNGITSNQYIVATPSGRNGTG